MNFNINKQFDIKEEQLDKSHYMEALLQEATRLKMLSPSEAEKLQIQLIGFLSKQVERYTHGESSSVKVETAQEIMQSIFYSIGIYLKSLSDTDLSLNSLKNEQLSDLFLKGQQIIKKQINEAKVTLSLVNKNKVVTNNSAYNSTINLALIGFFKIYDIEFGSHETSAIIDYPLCIDKMDTVGIEYINVYIKKLYWENEFCRLFTEESISKLMKSYHTDFQDLLINIFQLVLTNSFACVLLKKSAFELNITAAECDMLQKLLTSIDSDEFEKTISNAANNLIQELNITSSFLIKYITESFSEIKVRLANVLKRNQLSSLFIIYKEDETTDFSFSDGLKMDDELFMRITQQITDCSQVNDKIAIISGNVHSFEDLHDILCADCIFDDEYLDIFNSLEDVELALLYKMLPSDILKNQNYNGDLHLSSSEKEWQSYFISYINNLEKDRMQKLLLLSDKIEL